MWQFAAKRVLDVLGAAVALLIGAPFVLLAWAAIRIEDRGPRCTGRCESVWTSGLSSSTSSAR